MIYYHSSKSRHTERFVLALNLPYKPIITPPTIYPYILITPTVGDGDCPEPVLEFLSSYYHLCRGAIIGGNRNFGASFAGAGKVIQAQFGIKTLYKFEIAGTEKDVEICREGIKKCLS